MLLLLGHFMQSADELSYRINHIPSFLMGRQSTLKAGLCISHAAAWFKEVSRLLFSGRGEENGYIASSSIIWYLACQEKCLGPTVAVRWEMCQVVPRSSRGWGDVEFLVLGSSMLPLPINCWSFSLHPSLKKRWVSWGHPGDVVARQHEGQCCQVPSTWTEKHQAFCMCWCNVFVFHMTYFKKKKRCSHV